MLRRAGQAIRHRCRPDRDDLDRRPGGGGARARTRRLPQDELDARLAGLRGEVELPIPAASAVKIGGERAYRLARRGVEVEMPLRRSQVYALDVIAYRGDSVRLELHVGSGTYVRAIADGTRRPLRDAAADRCRAVPGRGGRPGRGCCRSGEALAGCRRTALGRACRRGCAARCSRSRRSGDADAAAEPRVSAVNVAQPQASSSAARGRSRSARSTASTSATAPSCAPRSRPGRCRRSSPSIRIRARCSATRSSCCRRSSAGSSCSRTLGVEETLVVEFTPEVAALEPEEFARSYLAAIGTESSSREHVPVRHAPARRPRTAGAARSASRSSRSSQGVSSTGSASS